MTTAIEAARKLYARAAAARTETAADEIHDFLQVRSADLVPHQVDAIVHLDSLRREILREVVRERNEAYRAIARLDPQDGEDGLTSREIAEIAAIRA
jgi:hypothetical protein